jgi:hypothetical protein
LPDFGPVEQRPERKTGLKSALGVSQQYGIALWRDPRRAWLLMWAYFLLSLAVGPVISLYIGPAGPSPMSASHWYNWIFSAFFAWRVASAWAARCCGCTG